MPTYDYGCDDCGHVFEVFERIHEGTTRDCPKCHRKRARRRISAPAGLIFRGSGFYVTEHRGSSAHAASSDTAAKKSESKPSDSKKSKSE